MKSDRSGSGFLREVIPSLLLAFLLPLIILPFQYLTDLIGEFLQDYPLGNTAYGLGATFLLIAAVAMVETSLVSKLRIGNQNPSLLTRALKRGVRPSWIKGLAICFIGCLCSFLTGAALGSEAPSVYMGALLGGFLYLTVGKRPYRHLSEGIIEGAGTGFALAFSNPIAGFLMQASLKRQRDERLVLTLVCATLSWIWLSLLKWLILEGARPQALAACFLYSGMQMGLRQLTYTDLRSIYFMLIPAVILVPLVFLFNRTTKEARRVLSKPTPLNRAVIVLTMIFACFLLRLFQPEVLGTGASLVSSAIDIAAQGIGYALVLLVLRTILSGLSFASPLLGGAVIPTIALGSLVGATITAPLLQAGLISIALAQMLCLVGGISALSLSLRRPLVGLSLALSFCPFGPALLCLLPAIAICALTLFFKGYKPLAVLMLEADIDNGIIADLHIGHHLHSRFFHGEFLTEVTTN